MDQAEPLALGYGRINKIRVNFLFNEPAIEFGYSFVGANPMVTRNMHLKSYEDVGMDPGKLFLHVVKDGQCRGRLLSVSGL
ncbi:hypothetical protein TELCIR_00877 [Teladorsagia circumcincta]|uniref:Uncharacterized protein n=1 Tax=Teladorsagia circumcincta TaxID=45464 RepID=A0A2G9V3H3_TELCI|nr:hypothetical protein TELCIR_00877 [Teladorsagia circumcincta]